MRTRDVMIDVKHLGHNCGWLLYKNLITISSYYTAYPDCLIDLAE